MQRHLSAESRKVVSQAERYASELGQEYIGTEHILLALTEEPTRPAGKALADHGVQPSAVRKTVEKLIRRQVSNDVVLGHLPISHHLKNVMQSAIELAEKRKTDQVDAKHLLLAIIAEGGSVARAVLDELGIDAEALEQDLLA